MEKIRIGKAVNTVGLKGELKVFHYSDYKERFEELSKVWLNDVPYAISGVRYVKDLVILKLDGIDSRTEAERHKGEDVWIDESDVRELPEDTYHIFELIGLTVVEEGGGALGVLTDVIKGSAQDLYEVEQKDKRKFLIPAVEEFITRIDLEGKTVTVKLVEGLMQL